MKIGFAKPVSMLGMFFACICALSSYARADTFSFSFYEPYGDSAYRGTIYGTIDLPFITSPTGSGTGAATSLILTSIPAAFGTLVAGDVATDWLYQYANSFTLVNGVLTSDTFVAYSYDSTAYPYQSGDVLALNSTTNYPAPGLDELNQDNNFGYNYPSPPITLIADLSAPTAVTPEPGTLVLLGTGLGGLVAVMRRRK